MFIPISILKSVFFPLLLYLSHWHWTNMDFAYSYIFPIDIMLTDFEKTLFTTCLETGTGFVFFLLLKFKKVLWCQMFGSMLVSSRCSHSDCDNRRHNVCMCECTHHTWHGPERTEVQRGSRGTEEGGAQGQRLSQTGAALGQGPPHRLWPHLVLSGQPFCSEVGWQRTCLPVETRHSKTPVTKTIVLGNIINLPF